MNQNVVQSVLGGDENAYSDAHLHKFIIVGTGVSISLTALVKGIHKTSKFELMGWNNRLINYTVCHRMYFNK